MSVATGLSFDYLADLDPHIFELYNEIAAEMSNPKGR